jgi:hypothetical protein
VSNPIKNHTNPMQLLDALANAQPQPETKQETQAEFDARMERENLPLIEKYEAISPEAKVPEKCRKCPAIAVCMLDNLVRSLG